MYSKKENSSLEMDIWQRPKESYGWLSESSSAGPNKLTSNYGKVHWNGTEITK